MSKSDEEVGGSEELQDPRTQLIIEKIANGYSNQGIADELNMELEEINALVKIPAIQAEIREMSKKVLAQFGGSKEQIVTSLKTLLFADLTQFYDNDGKFKPIDQIPLALRQCITELEFKHGEDRMGMPITNVRVKTIDKMKAIEVLARIEGLFDTGDDSKDIEFEIGFE